VHRLAADEGRAPLDASRLDLALWVLGTLADCGGGVGVGGGGAQSLPVPDSSGVLTPASVGVLPVDPGSTPI